MSDLNGPGGPLSPGQARRRLGVELRLIREGLQLTLAEAGKAIERSAATVSRFESAKSATTSPRVVDVAALLRYYRSVDAQAITEETNNRIVNLAVEGRKEQWFEPFKDLQTGALLPDHALRFVGYETDASEIRTYESDVVPGALQTRDYTRAVTERFFPNHTSIDRFVEFRSLRQQVRKDRTDPFRLSVLVNEIALRRVMGSPRTQCDQLRALIGYVRGEDASVGLRVVESSTAIPAAIGGPFVILSFPPGSEEQDLVYIETRSGGDYLTASGDVERFHLYFQSLLEVALSDGDSVGLVESIIRELESALH